MREADGEGSEAFTRDPAVFAVECVEGGVKDRRVCGFAEGLLRVIQEADDGFCPGGAVVRVAAGVAPEDFARGGSSIGREGIVDAEEAVTDELVDLIPSQSTG